MYERWPLCSADDDVCRMGACLWNRFIIARSELHKVLFWRSVTFCLCMKYLGNRWTDLRQIHMEDVFGPSLGKFEGQGHQGQKRHFSVLSAACVQIIYVR